MNKFNLMDINCTKYMFFTGKGGVGKTSIACASAVKLADEGKRVLLISTDPASNLQDVFQVDIDGNGVSVGVANLTVINVDPIVAAAEYKESVIAQYRGKLPDILIANMEEQLSGSCTVEIAGFNEFTKFMAHPDIESKYDHIIFDTAPTGHTLRMLQLPSAWSNFIGNSTHGASCVGQLSGLESKKEIYKLAVQTLMDERSTMIFLVTRPEATPLAEVQRAYAELINLNVTNQFIIINGLFKNADDEISSLLLEKQEFALANFSNSMPEVSRFYLPLKANNIVGIDRIRQFFCDDEDVTPQCKRLNIETPNLDELIKKLVSSNKKVIFTMGKGGVGKTTIATELAIGMAKGGKKVLLATTDPTHQIALYDNYNDNIITAVIDEQAELNKYRQEILDKAKMTMSSQDLDYIEEDLRSPCTQEIAVFRAFAEIVNNADDRMVIIDTAPSGHTLLLLDSTLSFHREVERTQGEIPDSVKKLLPRLRNSEETAVIIVTLPEATPVYEALRLQGDLQRAEINVLCWVINSSMYKANPTNKLMKCKADNEVEWITKVADITHGNFYLLPWQFAK